MQALAGKVERISEAVRAGSRAPTSWFTVSLVSLIALVMAAEIVVTASSLRWIVDTFGLHSNEADWGNPHFLFTLVSNQFIHQGGGHFFFNALLLLLVGATVEQRIGWRYTLGLWLAGGIFSNIAHIAFMPDVDRALIGASGGVSVLFGVAFVVGAGVGIPLRLKPGGRTLGTLTLPMVIGAWVTLQVVSFVQFLIVSPVPGTAYWAHLAGFSFGAFAATTLLTTSTWRLAQRPLVVAETASAVD